MEIKAELNHLHVAPRKVRSVVSLIRGMDVGRAEFQLRNLPRRSAGPVLKLLRSAVADALHNFGAKDASGFYIKKIVVDEGPVLKRMTPRAFGRGALIRKRMSHVKLTLDSREMVVRPAPKKKKEGPVLRDATVQDIHEEVSTKDKGEKESRKIITRPRVPAFVRRVFRRKAI